MEFVHEACGIRWTQKDIARFLRKCIYLERSGCLIWVAGKSKGRGKSAWYGSFWTQGKTVRSHRFYGVAILGLRPTGNDHLDHTCQDPLCVRHLEVKTALENLQLVWQRKEKDLYGYAPPKPTYQSQAKGAALPLSIDDPEWCPF